MGINSAIATRLKAHAEFMRQLEAEGWERKAASAEALRMLETIDDYLAEKSAPRTDEGKS